MSEPASANAKRQGAFASFLPYFFSILLLAVIGYLLSPPNLALKDLPEFYAPGRFWLTHRIGQDLYSAEAIQTFAREVFPGHETPVLYIPPYGVPLLLPLGFLPSHLADPAWFVFLVLCSFASVVLLKVLLKLDAKHVMRIAGVLCLAAPEWEAIRHGQLAPLLLLSFCAGLFFISQSSSKFNEIGRRGFFDNSLFAALALTPMLIKPQLVLPVVAFIAGGLRLKCLAGITALFIALNMVSLSIFGADIFVGYSALLKRGAENRLWQAPDVTPTIRGQLLRLFPASEQAVFLISTVCLCLALALIAFLGYKFRKDKNWWQYLTIGALPLGLFTALHCHNYDLLLLVPAACVFIFGEITEGISRKNKLAWLCLLIPFMMPIYNKIHYEYLLVGGTINILFIDLLIMSCAATVWLLKRRPSLESSH